LKYSLAKYKREDSNGMEISLRSMASITGILKRRLRSLPIFRAFTYRVPPYLTGSVMGNRLGLQVLRLTGKHIAWKLRKAQTSTEIREYIDTLDRDGVLVIPDFLSQEKFKRVKEECEAIKLNLPFESFRKVDNGSLQVANYDMVSEGDNNSAIRECLQANPLIQRIAGTVIRRKILSNPTVRFSIYRKIRNGEQIVDNDIESVLHADLHTPTVKAFYYVGEIDQSNGAFVYVKGSHRLTLNRIRHEYEISLLTAKMKRGERIPQELLSIKGPNQRVRISDQHLQGMQETTICGKANTLVIANNMGFHKRGTFTGETSRETLLINFRHFERAWGLSLF
jgi:hypothetical protein